MGSRFARLRKFLKSCGKEIRLKDKGLILIMVIFIIQCIHNLFVVEPVKPDYITINVIIRTSVAAIFGYFLSANFLIKAVEDEEDAFYKLNLITKTLKNNNLSDEKKFQILSNTIENQTRGSNDEQIKEEDEYLIKSVNDEETEEEKKVRYICNRSLQNAIALSIVIVISIALIIGVNFDLIKEGSTATISQCRDLISASIGFLIGNTSNNKNKNQ